MLAHASANASTDSDRSGLRSQVEKVVVVIQLGLVARAVHQGDRLGDAARQQFVDHRARAG